MTLKCKWCTWKLLGYLLPSAGYVNISQLLSPAKLNSSLNSSTTASALVHTAAWVGCQVLVANPLSSPETQSPLSANEPPSLHRGGGHLNSFPDLLKLHPLKKQIHYRLHSFRPQQKIQLKRPPLHPASLHLLLRWEVLSEETPNSRSQWCQHPKTPWREFTNQRVRKTVMLMDRMNLTKPVKENIYIFSICKMKPLKTCFVYKLPLS